MLIKRLIRLDSLAIILSFGILIGCGPSVEEQAATSVALTAAAATSTPRPTSTPTPIPDLLVPEDYPSIQEAIDAAGDGDSIIVSPGTYQENIDFGGKNITVRSTDPGDSEVVAATKIRGGRRGSVVTFQSGETAEARLEGFTITHGSFVNGGGILVDENSSPTIKHNTISDNLGQTGGGILVGGNSSPIISDNTISGNQADFGSGIAVFESSPTIEGNIISDNVAEQNGGGMLVVVFSSPTIEGNVINGNMAGVNGGGIQVQRSSPTIKDNTISDNHAEQFGGGLVVINNSSPTISGNTISENQAAMRGGGIWVGNSSPTISDNTISDNRAEWGAGIDVLENSSPTIENNIIIDNQAKFGSGIAVFESSPTIEGNSISGNVAEQNGGGISVFDNSSPTIKDNIISDNQAGLTGGGIDVFDNSSPMVAGNEFQSNTAGINGGAIWVGGDSTLILNDPDDNVYEDNQPDDIYLEVNTEISQVVPPTSAPALAEIEDTAPAFTSNYSFGPPNQGLSLSNALANNAQYSIEMVFNFSDLSGYRKVIDFQNLASDNGLYTSDTALEFYPRAPGPSDAFTQDVDAHLLVTRDASTNVFIAYVNGVQQISFIDSGGATVFTSNIIQFFKDDFDTQQDEVSAGAVDRILIYDSVVTPSEVTALFQGTGGPVASHIYELNGSLEDELGGPALARP